MGKSRENIEWNREQRIENGKAHRDTWEENLTGCGSCDTIGSGWKSKLSLPSPDLMSLLMIIWWAPA